eukprot:CAMPEP_0167784794 /NCGR_PEP_ID=MMETSP0111_2-20121227/7855_1 /TAXON_ID=91324 /ORGANISM="Lotharella globosa, Strain CCCM811" /LENGTH=94 /DNA_ID=CAMNT_0007675945 /DNA_START=451 /DNA_END=733 /DNA_ORIENTATION=-
MVLNLRQALLRHLDQAVYAIDHQVLVEVSAAEEWLVSSPGGPRSPFAPAPLDSAVKDSFRDGVSYTGIPLPSTSLLRSALQALLMAVSAPVILS